MPKVRNFTILPTLPDALKDLEVLAKNMFWSWNPEFIRLFKRIDSNLWRACGYNPVRLLGAIPQEELEALARNQGFLCELSRAIEKQKSYLNQQTWFQRVSLDNQNTLVAYFSAEFGLHECLPFYSGGLGLLAGDHLKSASDLGIPLVGVGLLYQKGYLRQYLNVDGWQQEVYVENDFYNMPIELVKDQSGQPLTISVEYPDELVQAQIWCVSVGRVKLYLLDTNIVANSSKARMITAHLYGGDREMRICQEIMLGIGGLRALTVMGIEPTVCHMNEGHAAFMALERIRQLRENKGLSFIEALEATRPGNVFTVHTPVKAGNDEFSMDMMDKYFSSYISKLGIDKNRFLALGRFNCDDNNEPFKMPVLAFKLSSCRNGVSEAHGRVSRKMWSALWPDVPVSEVPITSVTNGVHIKTWLSHELTSLYERYLGANWNDESLDRFTWNGIDQIPDEELWRTHQRCKGRLIAFARTRLKAQMQRRGTYHTELNWAEEVLDPEALTIGFARRFATYKRGNLLLRDPKRLVKLLCDRDRPVQIIFAGKAHPKDSEGKEIIRQIIHFANHYDVRRRIVFLEDYDINVARFLVRGVDLWLNTPRVPMEASGTSGMKAAINGALNLSTLDGWWCEGYKPEGGWAIGAGETYADAGYQDMVESQAVYNILENEIVPLFYTRSGDNLPRAWIKRVKSSIKWITPRFNTNRMVAEYAMRFYKAATAKWRLMTADDMSRARELSQWKEKIETAWPKLAIKDVEITVNGLDAASANETNTQLKVGAELHVKALVNLEGVDPYDVSVELYHGCVDTWGNIQNGTAVKMAHQESADQNGEHCFVGVMPCTTSGRRGMAVRVLPRHADFVGPHDLRLILWETADTKTSMVVT